MLITIFFGTVFTYRCTMIINIEQQNHIEDLEKFKEMIDNSEEGIIIINNNNIITYANDTFLNMFQN